MTAHVFSLLLGILCRAVGFFGRDGDVRSGYSRLVQAFKGGLASVSDRTLRDGHRYTGFVLGRSHDVQPTSLFERGGGSSDDQGHESRASPPTNDVKELRECRLRAAALSE
jgi:hypothetical protein